MSVLDQSVKKAIKALQSGEYTPLDFRTWLEREKAGKNRKALIGWLEKQIPEEEPFEPIPGEEEPVVEETATTLESTDSSAPDVEPVYVEPEVYVGVDSAVAGADESTSHILTSDPVLAGPSQGARDYIAPARFKAPQVTGIDSIEGGVLPISELIDALCQKRDRWQRSRHCGLENIKVHVSDIQITVP